MAVVRSVSLIAAVAAFFLAVVIRAADVTITSFECDSGLNVTAYDFEMDCYPHDGYCMMGQDVTLSGNSKWLLRWRVTSLGIFGHYRRIIFRPLVLFIRAFLHLPI